jgi:hypothetical protein
LTVNILRTSPFFQPHLFWRAAPKHDARFRTSPKVYLRPVSTSVKITEPQISTHRCEGEAAWLYKLGCLNVPLLSGKLLSALSKRNPQISISGISISGNGDFETIVIWKIFRSVYKGRTWPTEERGYQQNADLIIYCVGSRLTNE